MLHTLKVRTGINFVQQRLTQFVQFQGTLQIRTTVTEK